MPQKPGIDAKGILYILRYLKIALAKNVDYYNELVLQFIVSILDQFPDVPDEYKLM